MTRRLLIGSAAMNVGLWVLWTVGLWFWPWLGNAFSFIYFGFAVCVIVAIWASWRERKRIATHIPQWRYRLYMFAVIAGAFFVCFASVMWALVFTGTRGPLRPLLMAMLGVNALAFFASFFGRGWSRVALPLALFNAMYLWMFRAALD